MLRPRLLPMAIVAMAALFVVKAGGLFGALEAPAGVIAPARAADPPAAAPREVPPPV
ncbi:hypothetical protein GXW76_21410, partial [Roseomonas soli]|nr:hypothetical protein [Neoroseomonas soli]